MKKGNLSQKTIHQGILKKGMVKYVKSDDKSGYNQSMYNTRLIDYAARSLRYDLPLLAERLDEDMQSQIFNQENLIPFFKTLFKVDYKQGIPKEELERRRQRLLKLCYELLTWMGYEENAWKLAPNSMNLLLKRVPIGLQAILAEAY